MSPSDAPPSGRPTRAEIDIGAFESNLRFAARLGGDRREVMAVVKADAYGHGAVPLAAAALRVGASCLGVATLEEARRLRVAGIGEPIYILSEVLPAAAAEVVDLGCTQVLYTLELAEALERAAAAAGTRASIHLKIDTGMGRVGVDPSAAVSFSARLRQMPHLLLEGVLSHLAEADIPDRDSTLRQLGEFSRLCRRLERDCPELRYHHIANSALLMRKEAMGDLTRPGIMLYGSPPAPGFPGRENLRPVMRLLTGLAFMKKVPAGTPLSYGGTHVTRRESLIATLPVGYADGYPRRLSNRVEVLVRGRRAPQVGTICMDMCLVDVTDVPGAAVGDEAVLMGRQGEEEITVGELAELLGTITYEITCAVSDRVPRIHFGGESGGAATSEAGERVKPKARFTCQSCGFVSPRWVGRCQDCGVWNSFVEEAGSSPPRSETAASPPPQALDAIALKDDPRISSGSGELDRVLGGGIVPGSVVLLGGDPGIGKTTLLLEALGRFSDREKRPVLYCTGEESPRQIKLRAERLQLQSPHFLVYAHNSVEGVMEEARKLEPAILVIDSVQTMTSGRLESSAGSVGQVRQVAGEIVPFAKARDLPVFLVGHVTKDGSLAGPRVLEHMVDTVLYFEGENTRDYRILRAVKNRFGSTNEIGIFEMSDRGLREVSSPSHLFLRGDGLDLAGSVVTAALEGTRPFLVEIQALCAPTGFSVPRRRCSGADPNRFAMLIAVLERKIGLNLRDQDVYLNFAGGLRVTEPAADAGILTAIYSSFRGEPVDHGTVIFGEVGLTGEIRAVANVDRRLREAQKLGFRRCMMPTSNLDRIDRKGLEVELVGFSQVYDLFQSLFS